MLNLVSFEEGLDPRFPKKAARKRRVCIYNKAVQLLERSPSGKVVDTNLHAFWAGHPSMLVKMSKPEVQQ